MVKVNGKEIDLDGKNLSDYIAESEYDIKFIAVEINEELIPKAKYSETIIHDGDKIEVVSFVGGG